MPFADAASDDLPLSRLLRLSLFQISVGMAMVMLVGTLNRVMIVELGVPPGAVGQPEHTRPAEQVGRGRRRGQAGGQFFQLVVAE